MMERRLLHLINRILAVLLIGAMLAACAPRPQAVDAGEAQRMAFEAVTSNLEPDTLASYRVLGSQAGFDGHVIAYWMCQPEKTGVQAQALSGFLIVRQYSGDRGIQYVMNAASGLPADGEPVEFTASANEDMNQKVYVVWGRILAPEARAVEVLYADGQTLRWPAGGEGFLLFRQEPVEWRELRVLDENEQVLKAYELNVDGTTLSERQDMVGAQCPEES